MKAGFHAVQRERLGRLVAAVPRVVIGAVGSVVIQGLFLCVLGPLSDRGLRQIVAESKVVKAASLVVSAPRHWIADAARRRTRLEKNDAARQSLMDAAAKGRADHD